MHAILVANIKGGCGKTTIATNLAAALAAAGHEAALADVDRQRSSLAWLDRRPAGLAPVRGLNWTKSVDKPPKGLDFLVIDAPAALKTKQIEDLVRLADMVVLPVLPSAFDETATARFLSKLDQLKPIAKAKTPVAVVGNRMRAGTRAAERPDRFLSGIGHGVVTRLRDSLLYVEAADRGIGIVELRTRRAVPVREDWTPLIARVVHGAGGQ